MKRKKGVAHNSLALDMRCTEGRCLVQIDISAMTDAERKWLFGLLVQAEKGREVGFGVDTIEGTQIIKFTLAAVTESVAH